MKEGMYAIKWPNALIAYRILLSPTRGLFFWTPFLVMAGFGYWKLVQADKRLFWITFLFPLLTIIAISGRTWDWGAGPTLGPRYLAPILPLLALPCALGLVRFPRLGMCLAIYSILITTMATLTDACPFTPVYSPLTEMHIPFLLEGKLSYNLGMVMGLQPYASIAFYYLIIIAGIWWLWRRLQKENAH
jgi:hypothetical protein